MKKVVTTLGILALLAAAAVALVFYLTRGVTRSGDRFLALVREGRTHEAYLATAQAFRSVTSEEGFASYLKSWGLAENVEAQWSSRSFSGSTGELEGSVRTRSGGTVPLKLKLVKEEGEWRILAIERVAAGVIAATPPPLADTAGVPPEVELQGMATDAILRLGRAVTTKDFAEFHGWTAALWRGQTTPEALLGAFQQLVDQGADLSVVEGRSPTSSKAPAIDGSGRLVLEGFFPTEPTRVSFTLKYIREARQWKLVGVNVSLEPAPAAAASPGVVPPETELKALTHRALTQLAAAVARDDFSKLHEEISELWRRQVTPDELRGSFRTFVDKKVPLNVIETSAPVFTQAASIDSDGMLNVAGYYPTKPIRVTFELRFLGEQSQWRLAGIQVNTKEE